MDPVIVTEVPRIPLDQIDTLAGFGVATAHEALGRTGLIGPGVTARQDGARIAGSAVTTLCWPGDNLMIHAAVEQCGAGDVLVVAVNSPCTDGMFGELFATALQTREVRGLVIDAGVRDLAELRGMGFPVWSRAVNAQGTVKATAGAVNVPVLIGGAAIRPGDVIIADDDGVLCVPAAAVPTTIDKARVREDKEAGTREAFRSGELGLDRYGLRPVLADLGVRYLTAAEYAAERDRTGRQD